MIGIGYSRQSSDLYTMFLPECLWSRYLQICEVLRYVPGITRAHYFLGDIAAQHERCENTTNYGFKKNKNLMFSFLFLQAPNLTNDI